MKWRAGKVLWRRRAGLGRLGYGWKNSLRDADHERLGVYAVDETGHVLEEDFYSTHQEKHRWQLKT